MKQYLDLLRDILDNGVDKMDRTGVGTRSVFGRQMRFNLNEGFPLLTTKKMHLKSIIYELLWFIKGDTNVKYLQEHGVRIWNEWADEGDGIDQLAEVIETLKRNPNDRRMIVSAWNPSQLAAMHLPPCHMMFQFYVANGKLSCLLYQRSCDMFLGVPFNIASYALLTMMIAQVCELKLGEFVHTLGDTHIYHNHFEQVKEQLSRVPLELPQMKINPDIKDINDFKFEDFELQNYQSYPPIKATVAV